MTKKDLMNKLESLLKEKGMSKIDSLNGKIGWNGRKSAIEDAIQCLEASDEEMNDYLTVVKLKYPGIYNTVINNGNWLLHSYNRYFVYSTAKTVLA